MQSFARRVDRAVHGSHARPAGARIRPGNAPADILYYVMHPNVITQPNRMSSSCTVETTLDEVLEWLGRSQAELEVLLA